MLNPDAALFSDEIGKSPTPQKTPWVLIAVLALLVGLGIWLTTRPPATPLSKKEGEVVQAKITKDQEQVHIDTSRARQTEENATVLYQAGEAYKTIATLHHQQSKPHANPVSISDTAARRLERYLSTYGTH